MSRPDRSRYFVLAHQYVGVAVRNGDLPKLDGSIACVDCSRPATQYDHRDYKRPMDVAAVCRACNQARGPGLHRDPSETGVKPPTIRARFGYTRAPKRVRSSRRGRPRNTERETEMAMCYGAGMTLQQVGIKYGVSRERVRQILARAGVETRPRGRQPSH